MIIIFRHNPYRNMQRFMEHGSSLDDSVFLIGHTSSMINLILWVKSTDRQQEERKSGHTSGRWLSNSSTDS